MALAKWSGRRIARIWIVGALAEIAQLMSPSERVRQYAEQSFPRFERELARFRDADDPREERWAVHERAESLSVASQRRAAIEEGEFFLSATGDTVVGVVTAPSNAPGLRSPVAARPSKPLSMPLAMAAVLVAWGWIPVALVGITALWMFKRRRASDATLPG